MRGRKEVRATEPLLYRTEPHIWKSVATCDPLVVLSHVTALSADLGCILVAVRMKDQQWATMCHRWLAPSHDRRRQRLMVVAGQRPSAEVNRMTAVVGNCRAIHQVAPQQLCEVQDALRQRARPQFAEECTNLPHAISAQSQVKETPSQTVTQRR